MVFYKHNILGTSSNDTHLTPSPLGQNDHGDPDKKNSICGPTPGPLGINDIGDPHIMNIFLAQLPSAGGQVPKKDTFKTAIELFRKSPQSTSKTGEKVLKLLDDAYKSSKLSFSFEVMEKGLDGDSDRSTGAIDRKSVV